MITLADEANKSYKKQKLCYINKKGFSTDDDNKKYHKVRDQCHYKNTSSNLINNQPGIDRIYLYATDLYEAKYQFLINKRESIRLKYFNDPKAFIEYLNDTQDVQENIEESNLGKKRKIQIFSQFLVI